MKFYVAPLEGITGYIYRNALEKYFPGAEPLFHAIYCAGSETPFA